MITCLAMALGVVSLGDIPALAARVETEARALNEQAEITPALLTGLHQFSSDADYLSTLLREVGVRQDLPLMFHSISEDARARIAGLEAAVSRSEREHALNDLHMLLHDAILLAPISASAAANIEMQADNRKRVASARP